MARKPKAAKAPKTEATPAPVPALFAEVEIDLSDDEPAPVAVAAPVVASIAVAPIAVATIEIRSEPVKIEPVPVAAAPVAPAVPDGPAWKRWRPTKKST